MARFLLFKLKCQRIRRRCNKQTIIQFNNCNIFPMCKCNKRSLIVFFQLFVEIFGSWQCTPLIIALTEPIFSELIAVALHPFWFFVPLWLHRQVVRLSDDFDRLTAVNVYPLCDSMNRPIRDTTYSGLKTVTVPAQWSLNSIINQEQISIK